MHNPRFYVDWIGGTKTVSGFKRACHLAQRMSQQVNYASVRSMVLDGYRKLAEYRNGERQEVSWN